MELLAQQVLNGLVTGSVYSLVALGLTLTYGTLQVPNFAHGHLYMWGAYMSYTLMSSAGFNYWAAMAVSIVTLALAGAALERLVFRPLRNDSPVNAMIAALGVMLFLEAVAQNIWGEEFRHLESPYGGVVSVFGLLVTAHRLILLGTAAILMVALLLFLTRTIAGSAIRATAQNREGALLVGIDTNRVAMIDLCDLRRPGGVCRLAGRADQPRLSLDGRDDHAQGLRDCRARRHGQRAGRAGRRLPARTRRKPRRHLRVGDLSGPGGVRRARAGLHLQAERAVQGVGVKLGVSAALAIAVVLPLVVPNEYYLEILTQAYVFAISACGLNVILGFAGQLSLAHAGFFGIGAYTVALLATKAGVTFWAGVPAGIALSAAFGFAIGSICLRSKGHYFAIFTMAVGLIINLIIQKWESLTHGHVGVIGIPGPGAIGPIHFESGIARSYLALACLALTLLATMRLLRSPVGRTLVAVRESEPLAAAIGIDVMAAKRLAFTISAALAGLAGGLYAGFIGFLGPESSNIEMTFNTLLYVMVGGIGSVVGPVAGTVHRLRSVASAAGAAALPDGDLRVGAGVA